MTKRLRRFSRAQVEEVWRRWKQRETLVTIAAALACSRHSVYGVVRSRGGIAPAPRRRARWALSLAEREEISRGIAGNRSVRAMARELSRPPSTISREIRRNGGSTSYRATGAEAAAWRRARRPKPCRLRTHARLRHVVAAKLCANWSPEQIAAWLKCAYPHDGTMRLSHETIYRTLYVQARGALKHELVQHLRRQHAVRRPRGARARPGHARIVGAISIAERPPAAADRAVPGHWEGDLLLGTPRAGIVTLVERHSRYVLLLKPRGRATEPVVDALIRGVRRLPAHLWRSLTWDRGFEMADHARFTVATDVQVFFCDPQSPWQRGSGENTNGLLRQYFPKGRDLAPVTQRQLDRVAHQLNTRPRETLGWRTPADVLASTVTVALTG
jgi:IS30 family transposase